MKEKCSNLIIFVLISTIFFECSILYFDSWLDLEIYKKLQDEFDYNIGKLTYDRAILK
jgi:hypothetical protein